MYLAWGSAMATAEEYKQFAKECLRWATEAETDDDRNALLEMARDWTLAALRLDGVLVPAMKETEGTRRPRSFLNTALDGGAAERIVDLTEDRAAG
jgi:hypothetical protein